MKFEDLPYSPTFSVRAKKLFNRLAMKHETLEEFCKGDDELYGFKNAGPTTVNEVLYYFESLGFPYQGHIEPVEKCKKCATAVQQIRLALEHLKKAQSIFNEAAPNKFELDSFISSTLKLLEPDVLLKDRRV